MTPTGRILSDLAGRTCDSKGNQARIDAGRACYEAAEDYLRRGWASVPVCPPDHVGMEAFRIEHPKKCTSWGKAPAIKWKQYQDKLPTKAELSDAWQRNPTLNVGLICGNVSKLIGIDIDGDGGTEMLDELSGGDLPPTLEFITPSGGRRLIYAIPDGIMVATTHQNSKGEHEGISFLGQGGHTVMPPSRGREGVYEWRSGHGPEEIEPSPMPVWLIRKLNKPENSSERNSEYREPFDAPPANAEEVLAKCKFLVHCRDDAATLSEPEWYAMVSNIARTDCGALLVHELSKPYPGYTRDETDRKIQQSLELSGPHTCEHISGDGLSSEHCQECPYRADIVTPLDLGSVSVGLPHITLPGGDISISEAAGKLGDLMAKTGRCFLRGGVVMKLEEEDKDNKEGDNKDDRGPILRPVKSASLASDLERVAQLVRISVGKDGKREEVPTICTETTARLILNAETFRQSLPVIRVVTNCPVLTERNGQMVQVTSYDKESGILAAGKTPPDMLLTEAVKMIESLFIDFRFATPADRARAIAGFITPAMVQGGLLGGRAPMDLGEADASQTGKGYRNKITAAIYRDRPRTVTQRKGGVGGVEESFDAALISGAPFVCFDNVRGKKDSPALESFLTEESYLARIPYSPNIEIDPRRVVIMFTSNKAEITPDLANRSSCVRLLKQPDGYSFKKYVEGDLLDHVRKNQLRFLGAVFAVVKHWFEAGKPLTAETGHDFRPWAQTLDWIVQNIFNAGPLIEGHREAQRRMATPALSWLRDVAIAVSQANRLDEWLRTYNLLIIIEDAPDLSIPGLGEDDDLENESTRQKVLLVMGRQLGRCFTNDTLTIDNFRVERDQTTDCQGHDVKKYRISAIAPHAPAIRPAIKPRGSAITPIVSKHFVEIPGDGGGEINICYEPLADMAETRESMAGAMADDGGTMAETEENESDDAGQMSDWGVL